MLSSTSKAGREVAGKSPEQAALPTRREAALQKSSGIMGQNPSALGCCDAMGRLFWLKGKKISLFIYFRFLFYL